MSKIILWLVVGAVLITGGYVTVSKKKANENTTPVVNSTKEEQPAGKKMAFNEFVKQGGSYKCEVKQAMSDMENNGTVYLNGSNLRGEFSTIAEGRTMDTTFITRDGYTYTWSSALPSMGFKMKVATNTNASAGGSASTSGTYSWNAQQIGDYNCEVWTADSSKFAIPTNITFKEVGA